MKGFVGFWACVGVMAGLTLHIGVISQARKVYR